MHARPQLVSHVFISLLLITGACADADPTTGTNDAANRQPSQASNGPEAPSAVLDPRPDASTAPVDVQRPIADDQSFALLKQKVSAAQELDAAGLRASYAVPSLSLSYDPNTAQFLDRVQASRLALSDGERAALAQNGFVISTRREFPTFTRGFVEIYAEHLPLYVTADALLNSVHTSFNTILTTLERGALTQELKDLLSGMQTRLPSAAASAQTLRDMDLYLSVALGLLDDAPPAPNAGADPAQIEHLLERAEAADGTERLTLFGVDREEDFSQFAPRGHYASLRSLQQYFRALMWLGRVDFRLLETQQDGSQTFQRDPYLAMLLLHELAAPDLPRFERIDQILRTFLGQSDAMALTDVSRLIADLGGIEAAHSASDQSVATAILAGGYGRQQVASYLITKAGEGATLPLNRSFALFGQRYVVDSHVFSEVVHDRVENRLMPNPLDAAFAALGNNRALAYEPDLDRFPQLPGALARMRVLVDAHDAPFWDTDLYNLRLQALRALSPAPGDATTSGLPELARTEAWGRRVLNAQLGAWTELRHDALLYAKQSYSAAALCEFPDAYVDPYPALYEALRKYALAGRKVAELVADIRSALPEQLAAYFDRLAEVSGILGDMAARELRGEPFSEAQLAFINDAVQVHHETQGCSMSDVPTGWLARLFLQPEMAVKFDPSVVDVHTQPTDLAGAAVGNVLHAATGYPRLMVTTIDTCAGPRAYAGVVYAYHEETTTDFARITDPQWAQRFQSTDRPADVPWLQSVLAH